MQMIAHYTVKSYAAFRTAFDADAEDRGNNSLNLLQLWRESDSSAWALFDVGNARVSHVRFKSPNPTSTSRGPVRSVFDRVQLNSLGHTCTGAITTG